MVTFKEQFENTPPGPAREELVYQTAISMGPPKLVPISIKRSNGDTIIMRVMPDFLNVNGIFLPMSGQTAQRIANYFGLILPSSSVDQKIYEAAKQQGGALVAQPLSARTTNINGKTYTPEKIVQHVNRSELSAPFSELITQNEKYQQNKNSLVSGHAKSILAPEPGKESNLYLRGLYDKNGKPIQGGSGQTPHDASHAEYAANLRLISPQVEIISSTGEKKQQTISPSGSYLLPKSKYKPTITDSFKQAGPPSGYKAAKATPEIYAKAKELLNQMQLGEQKQLEINGKNYLVKCESHMGNPTSPAPKGISFYELKSDQSPIDKPKPDTAVATNAPAPYAPPTPSSSQTRMIILNRVKDFFKEVGIG